MGGGSAIVFAPIFEGFSADDYLITDPIIISEAGTYHLAFMNCAWQPSPLKILYGTSYNYEELELLIEYPMLSNYDWEINIFNFEIETPGNYFFAFYLDVISTGSGLLFIDNVKIGSGEFVGVPDIKFNYGLAPISSCEMSNDGIIGAELYNKGTEPIYEFTLTYQINNGAQVTQTFNEIIGLYQSVIVFFDETVDFSAVGEYRIKFTATTPNEINTNNNATEITVWHFEPITELPFLSEFWNDDDRKDWSPAIPGGWGYHPDFKCLFATQEYVPLLSRCIYLEPDVYRFRYNYSAGWWIFTDDFYITYGKSGTDPLSWEPVKEYFAHYTSEFV